ncbi:MAG: DUF1287 domain-containing protein [Rikenellaceae bacterium]|jgi:uncharacterized protein YijF (DUF1287 family)|nr:DUF1287 domain-containing protein [Rikenellaceae bacterium]
MMSNLKKLLFALFLLSSVAAWGQAPAVNDFYRRLADSTLTLTRQRVIYDPSYFRVKYPGGDVPADRGVCTDVVIRAYRKLGIDLQKEVHEDMRANFSLYPKNWGLKTTDHNIDHRRVPNLMVFFTRHGTVLSSSERPEDYFPGDVVCWNLGGGITHIGIIVERRAPGTSRPLVVHNIGGGQVLADCLFSYRIIGHYRYEK